MRSGTHEGSCTAAARAKASVHITATVGASRLVKCQSAKDCRGFDDADVTYWSGGSFSSLRIGQGKRFHRNREEAGRLWWALLWGKIAQPFSRVSFTKDWSFELTSSALTKNGVRRHCRTNSRFAGE